mmetsp:Transcript_28148/g.45196  ORF Transcript_28148/g.45196 Transcript_28148/m.45196 type:complete len:935 (-) Transcript_28148:1633-4437(-)
MPFQKQGVAFTVKNKGRVMICDEMGLGKTIQGIAFALAYRKEWPVLIIAPSSVKLNWADECEKWIPGLEPDDINIVKSRTFAGDLTSPITIVTYGMFSKTSKVARLILEQKFKVVLLDESHYIKSLKAIRTKMISPLITAAKRVALLSGTPALARPIELWPQVSSVRPDLFSTYTQFTKRFCNPRRMPWGLDLNGAANLDELHELTKQFVVRRLKKDVLRQLPPKRRQLVRLDIPERSKPMVEARGMLKALKAVDMKKLLREGVEGSYGEATSARNKQRMLLNQLYGKTGEAKTAAAADYILNAVESTDKVLVFAHHLQVLDSLQTELTRKKVKFMRIDGGVSTTQRHENVKKFQDPKSGVKVALLGLTSAGQGITLTAASTVIFVEMHWTPGILVQAEDRVHRIGQTNSVNIIYLTAKNTLDDIVWAMIERKLDTVGKAIDGQNRVRMDASSSSSSPGRQSTLDFSAVESSDEEQEPVSFPKGDMRTWFHKGAAKTPTPVVDKTPIKPVTMRTVLTENKHTISVLTANKKRKQAFSAPPSSVASKFFGPVETLDLVSSDEEEGDPMPLAPIPKVENKSSLSRVPVKVENKSSLFGNKKTRSQPGPVHIVLNDDDGDDDVVDDDIAPPYSKKLKNSQLEEDSIQDSEDDAQDQSCAGNRVVYHFCVSSNTGRVFLYDDEKNALGLNFKPENIRDNEPASSGLPPNILNHKESMRPIRAFVKQWFNLRGAERSALCGKTIKPPLLTLVYQLQKSKNENACFERYAEVGGGQQKDRLCVECNKQVPEQLRKSGVKAYCSFECYSKYSVKTNSTIIRRQLFELEHGICQICKEDIHKFYQTIKALTPPERYQILLESKFTTSKKLQENPDEGDFWQADHINPVALGGGQCDMLNFRTLCTPCHKRETSKLRRTLKEIKLSAFAKSTLDIRTFFKQSQ